MKYILGSIVLLATLILLPLHSVADQHEGPDCPAPDGCDWRTVITIDIVDPNNVSNWEMTWTSPRMSFWDNVRHAYLVLEHIFSRDAGAPEPVMTGIVKELQGPPAP